MKNILSLLLVFTVQLFSGSSVVRGITAEIITENSVRVQLTKQAWQQDVDKLIASIRNLHPNPWRSISEKKFKILLQSIVSSSQLESRATTSIKLMSAVAKITQAGGDGHTGLWPFQEATDFHLLPLRLYSFSDGIYILDADDLNQELVGHKLTAIAGTPLEVVVNKVRSYISYESDMWVKSWSPLYSIVSEHLEALNLAKGLNINITTEDSKGEVVTKALQSISALSYKNTFLNALSSTSLPTNDISDEYLKQIFNEQYWFKKLNDKTLYMQYNKIINEDSKGQLFSEFMDNLEVEIKSYQVTSLIVDVRYNPGSLDDYEQSQVIYTAFFEMVNRLKAEKKQLDLYVLTGRVTFSSATNFVLELDEKTKAIFIGEAMGGSSNYYGEAERIILPNSKLKVMLATRYWDKPGIHTSAKATKVGIPDYLIELSSKQYFSSIDPVISKALELIELNSYE